MRMGKCTAIAHGKSFPRKAFRGYKQPHFLTKNNTRIIKKIKQTNKERQNVIPPMSCPPPSLNPRVFPLFIGRQFGLPVRKFLPSTWCIPAPNKSVKELGPYTLRNKFFGVNQLDS